MLTCRDDLTYRREASGPMTDCCKHVFIISQTQHMERFCTALYRALHFQEIRFRKCSKKMQLINIVA